MSDSVKDLLVRILVDDDQVGKFTKAGNTALSFGNVLSKASAVAVGGLALLAGGGVAAAKAAADAEQSETQLQFALNKFPATADTSAAKLMKLNAALSLKTKFDEDSYASGQAVLAQYGLTGKQIEQLTPLLGDYAAKTGVDIPTAATTLGKALLGQGKSLKSIGLAFTDTKTLGGNYQELLGGLTDKVGGFADVQGKTAAGSTAILGNSVDDLMKKLGKNLLPVMLDVTKAGLGIMDWMSKNSGLVEALAGGIGTIAVGILALSAGMKIFAIVQAIQTGAQLANDAAWLASPITWIILAIIVAIGLLVAAGIWLYNNWGAVTKWIGQAWQNVLTWFKSVGSAITKWWNDLWTGIGDWVLKTFGPSVKWVMDTFTDLKLGLKIIGDDVVKWWNDFWNGLVAWDVQTFGPAIKWIEDTFTDLKVGMKIVGDDITSWWNGLWTNIGSFFGTVWGGLQGVVKNAWNGITGFIQSGVNGAISLINGIIRGINNLGGGVGIHLNLIPNISIPKLATGGIVTSSMIANIGEAGPEAIIPLTSPAARDILGGGGPTDLSDATIKKLTSALLSALRVQNRQQGATT